MGLHGRNMHFNACISMHVDFPCLYFIAIVTLIIYFHLPIFISVNNNLFALIPFEFRCMGTSATKRLTPLTWVDPQLPGGAFSPLNSSQLWSDQCTWKGLPSATSWGKGKSYVRRWLSLFSLRGPSLFSLLDCNWLDVRLVSSPIASLFVRINGSIA